MSWSVKDRWGNEITLSEERWQHIIDGHWELVDMRAQVLDAVRLGTRKQNPMDPNQYRYTRKFSNLSYGYTYIVVIARLKPSQFVITAYPKRVR
jgi:hypothetical protein